MSRCPLTGASTASRPQVFEDIKEALGPVTILLWNHYTHLMLPPLEQTPEQLVQQVCPGWGHSTGTPGAPSCGSRESRSLA